MCNDGISQSLRCGWDCWEAHRRTAGRCEAGGSRWVASWVARALDRGELKIPGGNPWENHGKFWSQWFYQLQVISCYIIIIIYDNYITYHHIVYHPFLHCFIFFVAISWSIHHFETTPGREAIQRTLPSSWEDATPMWCSKWTGKVEGGVASSSTSMCARRMHEKSAGTGRWPGFRFRVSPRNPFQSLGSRSHRNSLVVSTIFLKIFHLNPSYSMLFPYLSDILSTFTTNHTPQP